MTLSYTKEKKDYKLNEKQSTALKNKIVKMQDDYYANLSPHIADYEKFKKHIYGILREEKAENYLSSKLYELRDTYISHLKNRCASSIESQFGIEGNTKTDQDNSQTMKAFIEDKLEKMDFLAEYDSFIPNYIDKGGAYSFVEWKTVLKEVKKIVDYDTSTESEATPESLPENIIKKRITKTITEYEGAKATSIDPFSIVYNKDKVSDWVKCEKIIKSWLTPEQIIAIEQFDISQETKDKLLAIAKASTSSVETNKPAEQIAPDAIDGDRIEVLNFLGDLRLPDGTYLENWHCVVVGRMEVVRFCKNPGLSIRRCVFAVHPGTGREFSPLLVGVINNDKKSEVFRDIIKALKFSINPHHFTNGDIGLPAGKTKVEPGGFTKLNSNDIEDGNPIIYSIDGKGAPLNMEVMPQFDADIEASTGINKYLTGNVEGSKVDFATEANGIMGGGEVRINKDVDNINRNLTRDTIQDIANLHANMIDSADNIKVRNGGKIEFKEVTIDVVQGSYEFKVSDAKQQSMNDKEAQLTTQALEKMTAIPNFKTEEAAKYVLESVCKMKDTSRFFEEDELQKQINAIPEQEREQAKQFLVQVLQNPQIAQGQQQPPAPTPNQFVMDISAKTICDDNRYPDNVKQGMLQMLGLQPTQEYIKKQEAANAPKSQAA